MRMILEQMQGMSERLNNALTEILHFVSLMPGDLSSWKPNEMFSVGDILMRVGTVAGLVEALNTVPDDKFALVPGSRMTGLQNAYSNLVSGLERAQTQLGQITPWGGFERFDALSGQIFAKNSNSVPAKTTFDEISSLVDNVLEAHIPIVATTQPRGIGTFVAAARELRNKTTEASRLVEDLQSKQAAILGAMDNTKAR